MAIFSNPIIFTAWGEDKHLAFELNTYANNGRLAISCYRDDDDFVEPYTTLTVNLPDEMLTGDASTHAFFDINHNRDMFMWLILNKLAEPTGYTGFSGFCSYPEMVFNLDKIRAHSI